MFKEGSPSAIYTRTALSHFYYSCTAVHLRSKVSDNVGLSTVDM